MGRGASLRGHDFFQDAPVLVFSGLLSGVLQYLLGTLSHVIEE
jgi:hypothetical protein